MSDGVGGVCARGVGWCQPVTPSRQPCVVPNPGRCLGVIGTNSPSSCHASAPQPGAFSNSGGSPTSGSSAVISHHSERSAQMHRRLQELLTAGLRNTVWAPSPATAGPYACHTKVPLPSSQTRLEAQLCLPLPPGR